MQKIFLRTGFELRTIQPVASRYTDYAILGHVFPNNSDSFPKQPCTKELFAVRLELNTYVLLSWNTAETRFRSRVSRLRFTVDKLALGQILPSVLPFSPVSIIPPVVHIPVHLHVTFTRRTSRRLS
jgi:hypothetical protein